MTGGRLSSVSGTLLMLLLCTQLQWQLSQALFNPAQEAAMKKCPKDDEGCFELAAQNNADEPNGPASPKGGGTSSGGGAPKGGGTSSGGGAPKGGGTSSGGGAPKGGSRVKEEAVKCTLLMGFWLLL